VNQRCKWGTLEWLAAALVIGVNAALASWAPLLIPTDGLDYLFSAYTLAHGGGFSDFVPYKAPGLTLVLGLAMSVTSHWPPLLHWLHAALLVASAGLTWLTARRLLGEGTAARILSALAAALVGVHPVLLTYQCYLLREGASAFLIPLAGWLIVRHMQDQPRGNRAILSAAALGAVCGLGALYRENFQTLLVLGPVLMAWAGLRSGPVREAWKPALAQGATAALLSVLIMSPWLFWMHRHYGFWSVTTPKTQFNRLINAWQNKLIDGTELPGLARADNDYDYVARAVVLEGIVKQAPDEQYIDVVIDALTHKPAETSDLCKRLLHTAVARRPAHAANDAARAALSLSGLWNIEHPAAHVNAWLALPIRGLAPPTSDNYYFDVDGMLAHSRFTPKRDRFDEIFAQSRVSTARLSNSPPAKVFNAWFVTFEKGRPILAALTILGCFFAVRKRNAGAIALALLVVVNVLGAAILMMTVVDRFAAPMLPLMILVAAYGVHSTITAAIRNPKPKLENPK
jgi:hypothetical protein